MANEINLEKLVYESKKINTLLELRRFLKEGRYEVTLKAFPGSLFPGMEKEAEFPINKKIRTVVIKELDKQIKEEGIKLKSMFSADID